MAHALGDAGEAVAVRLLEARGYSVQHIGGNFPVIDLMVDASTPFRVSVKTSGSKRHVRMGKETSIAQLRDDDFLFAFMPALGSGSIDFEAGRYELLILPGPVAREGGLYVHRTYLEGRSASGSFGVTVKSESRRAPQVETWRRFSAYRDRWELLPAPLPA